MAAPIVKLPDGQIRGKQGQDYLGGKFYSFQGIPYAKAPVGELRFWAPQPIEPWEGVRDATKEGPECPSKHMLFLYQIGAEDNCLNLNVYTKHLPNNDDAKSLKPVMVWIHGGGFLFGSNRSELYGPEYLITEDIVLVCINYRLGVLGFLSLEDPSLKVPGNNGLKDQIFALQWVQKNIHHFNGDPNNVTIFGESAGSAAVQYLYLSPLSQGLFHKAICQSGSCLNNWAKGCANSSNIAKPFGLEGKSEREILEHLRTLPAHKIVTAQHHSPDSFEPADVRPFGPVIEKYTSEEPTFLNRNPLEIIKDGSFNQVPLMMGYTSSEGMLFEAVKYFNLGHGVNNPTSCKKEVFYETKLSKTEEECDELATKIQKYYFGDKDLSNNFDVEALFKLRTDNMMLYGIHKSVSYQKLVSKAPIYFYKMSVESSLNYFKRLCTTKHMYLLGTLQFMLYKLGDGFLRNACLRAIKSLPTNNIPGTCHADDLGYLFTSFLSFKLEKGSDEAVYVKRFLKLWTNFAKTGNPTPDNDDFLNINWKPVTKEENVLLNIGADLKLEVDPDLERVQFWDSICEQ